jgi:hypothetical protein
LHKIHQLVAMRYWLIFILVLLRFSLFGQEKNDSLKIIKFFNADQIIYELNNNYWLNTPQQVIINPISLSSNAYLMFPLLGTHSNFSIAAGGGIGSTSIRYNSTVVESLGVSYLIPISDTLDVKHNKLVATYIEGPLELRYMTLPNSKGRSFRFTLGGKIGYLIGKHIKYLGENPDLKGDYIKVKYYKVKNLLPYRYGVYARIGYGKFAVTGFYSLTGLFKENKGPDITPYNVGLTLILF